MYLAFRVAQAQVRHHGALLGEAQLVHNADRQPVKVGGHTEHRSNGNNAGAADTGDQDAVTAIRLKYLQVRHWQVARFFGQGRVMSPWLCAVPALYRYKAGAKPPTQE